MQDLEQLHAHTVNRMSLSVAQPQATEQRKKYTMHMHNTADTSTRAQHGYKYICTTQVRVHMHNMWLQELWVRLAEEVPSHTAYVDTAHWSSTPCALACTLRLRHQRKCTLAVLFGLSLLRSLRGQSTLLTPPLFVELFEKYFENTTPCSLKICDSRDACNLPGLVIAEVCILRYDVRIHTDRQTDMGHIQHVYGARSGSPQLLVFSVRGSGRCQGEALTITVGYHYNPEL